MTGLVFVVSQRGGGSMTSIDRFEFGTFGFFSKNSRCDERFMRSGRTFDIFEGSMLVQDVGECGVEEAEIRLKGNWFARS